MRRTRTAVATLVAGALVTAVPAGPAAAADSPGVPDLPGLPALPGLSGLTDLLGGLLGATGPADGSGSGTAPPATDEPPGTPTTHPEWGSIEAASATYRKGCKSYTYSYALQPPEGLWALEVFITGPDGLGVANDAQLVGYDPLTGTGTFKVCRGTIPAGTFSITGRLSVDNGPQEPGEDFYVEGMLPTTTFVLQPPPKKHKPKVKHRHHHPKPKGKGGR